MIYELYTSNHYDKHDPESIIKVENDMLQARGNCRIIAIVPAPTAGVISVLLEKLPDKIINETYTTWLY